MANISGNLSDNARLIIVNESDWSVESNTEESSGSFEITGLSAGDKTIISRATTGECLGFGNVTPTIPNPWQSIWDNTKFQLETSGSVGVWTGSAWRSDAFGEPVYARALQIEPKAGSTWHVGFRPTKVRITVTGITGTLSVNIYDEWMVPRASSSSYTNLVELDITWGFPDLYKVYFWLSGNSSTPDYTVSNIEWYVE
jgi:hypothetical protein